MKKLGGMSDKAIERHIRGKVDEWLQSIEDEGLREYLQDKIIVTGGCITSMLLKEKINDYDIYLRTKEACERVARYYVEKFQEVPLQHVGYGFSTPGVVLAVFEKEDPQSDKPRIMVMSKSAGVAAVGPGRRGDEEEYRYFELVGDADEAQDMMEGFVTAVVERADRGQESDELSPYTPLFMTSNAISLSNEIQVVIRFYGNPKEIHQNFDFEHCKCYWKSWGKRGRQLVLLRDAMQLMLSRHLRYTGSRYPLSSLFRLRKFHDRGWYYSAGEMLKIMYQVADLDLHSPAVLEEQLLGMDIAYFTEVIRRIRAEGVESITSTYLAQLIDEIY